MPYAGRRRDDDLGITGLLIDWRAGNITLRQTKSRREDRLPLPEATGRAIADYLTLERPQSASRAVFFLRRIAPCDRPLGPDFVGKTIRQAYARAGLPYTRAHLLRHYSEFRTITGLLDFPGIYRHMTDVCSA